MRVEAEQRRSIGLETKRRATNHVASAVATSMSMLDGRDWQSFSADHFPGRRRHDVEALTAYRAYRHSHGFDARSSAEPGRIGGARGEAGSTALQGWEDEGGAAL
jgi:hypothetical protein